MKSPLMFNPIVVPTRSGGGKDILTVLLFFTWMPRPLVITSMQACWCTNPDCDACSWSVLEEREVWVSNDGIVKPLSLLLNPFEEGSK